MDRKSCSTSVCVLCITRYVSGVTRPATPPTIRLVASSHLAGLVLGSFRSGRSDSAAVPGQLGAVGLGSFDATTRSAVNSKGVSGAAYGALQERYRRAISLQVTAIDP
jgi:hypothetical protein